MAIELNLPSTITGEPAAPVEGLTDFVGQAAETAASVNEALGALNESISSGSGIQFPGNLGSRRIEFQVKPRNRPSQTTRATESGGTLIALPIPTNLQTGYGARYADAELGVLGAQVFNDVREGGSIAESLSGIGIDDLQQSALSIAASASPEIAAVLGGGALQKLGLGAAGIGAAAGAAAAGIAKGGLGAAGIAVNPHLAVLFEGMNFRNHSFSYKFSARNESESYALNAIIYEFKKECIQPLMMHRRLSLDTLMNLILDSLMTMGSCLK